VGLTLAIPGSRPLGGFAVQIGKRKINLSQVFAGQTVGIREVDDQIWLVSFLDYDLSFFDMEEGRVDPAPNPFAPGKVLTMCPE
jgi:putative transposase